MKAWHAEDMDSWDGGATIVFAETRGKARAIARYTDACEDADFTRIRILRRPALDDAYRGRSELDWYNAQDRIRMVRDGDFACLEPEYDLCESCEARDYCSEWEHYMDEKEG